MFSFLSKANESGDALAESESSIPLGTLRVENSESAETIRKAKQKAGSKPDAGKRAFTLEENDATSASAAEKILDSLLDPKVWKGAVGAPGDAMVAITGKKHWELSDDERDTLAKTGAATARCFAVTDPKWLALSLFSFSVISVYGSRLMKDVMDRSEHAKAMRVKDSASAS